MSIAEIERFAADLKSNEALRAEAAKAEAEKAEAGMSPETLLANAIAFAATKGYHFTADDMKECIEARAGKKLTDAELGGVVGGSGARLDAGFEGVMARLDGLILNVRGIS
jgi:hypothetical protein